jgi:hypothetical protein
MLPPACRYFSPCCRRCRRRADISIATPLDDAAAFAAAVAVSRQFRRLISPFATSRRRFVYLP